jgi:hypothetical protein
MTQYSSCKLLVHLYAWNSMWYHLPDNAMLLLKFCFSS